MKKVTEPKNNRGRTDASSVRNTDGVRVVRVTGSKGRAVRWHVSPSIPKK
jgi:hypothetical protein